MKMAKRTVGRVEKLINGIVILVMLLQPVGTPGLLLAVAEAPATEPVSEQVEKPAVADAEMQVEEPVAEAEEKAETDPVVTEEAEPVTTTPDPAPETEEATNEETSDETTGDTPEDPAPTEEDKGAIDPEVPAVETPVADPETPAEVPVANPEIPAEVPVADLEIPVETPVAGAEKECLADGAEIKNSSDDGWNYNTAKNVAETKDNVELGIKYIFPGNDKVSVTFTCLPGVTTPLKIEQINIADIALPSGVAAATEYAYDITTDMKNGDFEYAITLPKPEDNNIEVSYIEKSADEIRANLSVADIKEVKEEKIEHSSEITEVSSLDHFTVFLVTWNFPNNPDNAIADGGAAANLAKTITSIGTDAPAYAAGGATTNSARATGWDSGSGVKYWQVEFSAAGYDNIKLFSKQRSSSTGPKNFKIQYKIGSGGSWTDVPGGSVITANNYTNGTVSNLPLPSSVDNESSIYLRWIMTSNVSVEGGAVVGSGASNVDDIIVQGELIETNPICGDGIINQTSEQCDDGNTVDDDACNNQCELKAMEKETVRTCSGEGELYLYTGDPFQNIATSFTTERDQLLIFTGNSRIDSSNLNVRINGSAVSKNSAFSNSNIEIFSVDTDSGDVISIEGVLPKGARNVQGYLAQNQLAPVYDLSTARFIFNDNTEDQMYLTPGDYSYVFFDKFTYNSKSDQSIGKKDVRPLRVRIDGAGSLVDKTYTTPFPAPVEGAVVDNYTVAQGGDYTIKVDTEDSIFWALPKCERPKPTIAVNKVANPTTLAEPGGDATFTFTVTNAGIDPVTITSLEDDIFGALSGDADCQVGTGLAPNESCIFESTENLVGNAGDTHTNVFTAHAEDEFGVDATDEDDATVEFTGVPPTILVTKTANPTTVPETGGDVEFTFSVQNTSTYEAVTIISMTDSVYGTLAGDADCQVGTTLAVGATCEFSATKRVTGDANGSAHNNIFTVHAEDDDGTDAMDDDDATVEFTDVLPTVTLDKTVDDNSKPEPGGAFNYTLTITNTSAENVTITALTDDNVLSQECLDLIGDVLTPNQQVTCNYSVIQTEAGTYPNTAAVTVEDDEKNTATDDDSESVEVTDVLPAIAVLKTGTPTTVPETGGDVVFVYRVTNNSVESATITILNDDKFGALGGDADCQIGTILAAGAFCEFAATFAIPAGDVPGAHVDVFTGTISDDDGNTATDTDDETIAYTDVLPTVTLDKTVDDNSKPEPGGAFNYTLTITNTSAENVTITALTDDNVLSQECLDLIGDVLTPNQQVTCNYSVIQTEAGTYPNTAAVTVEDDEKNPATDDDSESVEVTDVLPVIEVLKTAGVSVLDVPSASVTFTFAVKNNSVEPVVITSIADDVFGTLIGDADCQLGTVLAPGASCSFDSIETVSGSAGAAHVNIFTAHAEDNEKNDAMDSEDEIVAFSSGRIIVDKITDPVADPRIFSFNLAGGPSPAVNQSFNLADLSAPHDSGLLFPGTYSVIETAVAGWQTSADCQIENQTIFDEILAVFPNGNIDPNNIVLEPGQTIRCTFTNTFTPPTLTIEKFNDQWPNIQDPGDIVDYTIIVRASKNNVNGAFVKDLMPNGFTFAGITSVQKNGSTLAVADPAYASPGTWRLGDLAQGDEVVIKFKANIGSSQDPGIYKDLAWAQGTDDRQAQVLATSVPAPKPDQGVVTDNFVGTQIELAPAPQPEAVILAESTKTETETKRRTKRVLGAAILPATGANPTWPLVALIILIVGFNLIMESKKRAKKNFAAFNKTLMKIFIFALFSGAMIFSINIAQAASPDPSISVRIAKPKAAVAAGEFKIGFVALDIKERSLTAKCFKSPAEEVPSDFVAKAGGNSGNCLIDLPDGTHQFYVVAYDPSNADNYGQSETVTVEINTGTPGTPLNYSRDEDSCTVNFTTANDGLTAGVELYRSTEISFAADDSTYVGTTAAVPNANGSVVDPKGACGDYYYAIRAVSAAGAGSAFVGDEKVTVKHKTRTRTRTITVRPEAATSAIPAVATESGAAAGAGSVEGATTAEEQAVPGGGGVVLGEETEGEEETSVAQEGFLRKNRWPLLVGVLIILAAIYVYRKKRSQGIEK